MAISYLLGYSCAVSVLDSARAASLDQQVIDTLTTTRHMVTLPVVNHAYAQYTTSIAAGNPPQNFSAIIDLAWSDAWLPSIDCHRYCASHRCYNASASATYVNRHGRVQVNDGGYYTAGVVATDSFHVGGIEVQGQVSENADMVHPNYFFDDTWYEATLPLARTTVPPQIDSSLSVPSVFENMMGQQLLSRNVVALRLPGSKHELGELTLGGANARYTDAALNASHLPIKDGLDLDPGWKSFWIHGGWYAEAVSVVLGSEPERISFDLRGYIAVFETVSPHILLPKAFLAEMFDNIGSDGIDCPCNRVDELPALTISLLGHEGEVHEFVIPPEDYLRSEPDLPYTEPGMCNFFAGYNNGIQPEVPDFISLGTLFLHKYYNVFDADRKVISSEY